ncbi:MAG TPA: sigma-70 family RNA polymerase sigma factor [Blastocatellia bacterium]|nr:sigma-70 family RNA polymerase sigma factor [Blastocatellia bacterium]
MTSEELDPEEVFEGEVLEDGFEDAIEDVFEDVFEEVYPALCRFLEGFTGKSGVAQELAQESFLRLIRSGADAVPRAEIRFWLFKVARNLALNELNRRNMQTRLIDRVASAFRAVIPDPHQELEHAERQQAVAELVQTLPEHQRAALLLREQEEMSYSEIARVLGVSEAKVRVDLFRARTALREGLREPRKAAGRGFN